MSIIDNQIDHIQQLCSTHKVDKMYIVGSATTGEFSTTSDLDFLVRFKPFDVTGYFDNYMDLKSKLEELFKRKVDLIEEQTLRNPVLIRSIERSKKLVYG